MPTLLDASLWPYLPTLERLALALSLGLFVGLERERRGKEAGLRTFGFAALLGAGALAAHGTLSPAIAANGAILASLASAAINLPVVTRLSHDRPLARRLAWSLAVILGAGVAGWVAEILWIAR